MSSDHWKVLRALVQARAALIGMRLDDASKAIARLKHLLDTRDDDVCTRYGYAVRTFEASLFAAQDEATSARSALVSVAGHADDAYTATLLRYLDWRRGGCREIYAPDPMDYLSAPVGGQALLRIFSLCLSAAVAFDRLQMVTCASLAAEALQLARVRYGALSPISSVPATLLAQVAYEQGRLEDAEALLRPRFTVIRASGIVECVARASVLLAKLALHRGRQAGALAILREAESLGCERRWPRLVAIASQEYERVIDGQRRDQRTALPLSSSRLRQMLAQIPDDLHSPEEAYCFSSVEMALRQLSSGASQLGLDERCAMLVPWLWIGASRGLRMVFVDVGESVRSLLERVYYALPTTDSRLCVLRPYIATVLRSTAKPNLEQPPGVIYRSLSHRETGILRLIAHGMSNKRIAQSLGITPETVKSHAKRIFVKLATQTRAQAVARAEAIGFL